MATPKIAIVDYNMGNLYSVRRACEVVGLDASITTDATVVAHADAAILPGVGAFGDAMATLRQLGMAEALVAHARAGKPLLGICLGLQLLMERSHEFGEHEGLALIPGDVARFEHPHEGDRELKVPQVGWNRVFEARPGAWAGTPFDAVESGVHQYFVHSYYVRPADEGFTIAMSRYGDTEFCSAARVENVIACQFHPERSGGQGMRVYERFAELLRG